MEKSSQMVDAMENAIVHSMKMSTCVIIGVYLHSRQFLIVRGKKVVQDLPNTPLQLSRVPASANITLRNHLHSTFFSTGTSVDEFGS